MCTKHCVHWDGQGMPSFLSYICCGCGQRGSDAWASKHPTDGKTPHGVFLPRWLAQTVERKAKP